MNQSSRKFSIITATFNAAADLEHTIASLRSQDYENFEWIVIDGGSTDGTRTVIENNLDIITYWVSEKDRGLADAWNKGLAVASGEIIGLLNAGDAYAPDVLSSVARTYTTDDVILYGDAKIVDQNRNVLRVHHKKFTKGSEYRQFDFLHTTCFVKSSIYRKVGNFSEDYRIAIDTDWLLRAIKCGYTFQYEPHLVEMVTGGLSDKYAARTYAEYASQLKKYGYSKLKTDFYHLLFTLKQYLKRWIY